MTKRVHTRALVIESFIKGQPEHKRTNSVWSTLDHTLYYDTFPLATKNPVTLVVTKVSSKNLSQQFSGSTLAAMVRGLKEIELYLIKDSSGNTVAENLAWFDAIQTKKAMKKEGLTIIKIE